MKISLFTPTHDSKYLSEVYESIKDQDFFEWLVIYNNGAKEIDFNDIRVKTIRLTDAPGWVGPLKAFACENCKGDILVEMDHDDWLHGDAIDELKNAFKDPEIGFVYSNTIHDKEHHYSEEYGWKYRPMDGQWEEHISFAPTPDSISKIWFAPNHLRAFRKSVYEQIGGYNKEMRVLDDLDLMCRMYAVTKFKHIDKGLYYYREHSENTYLKYNAEIQNNVFRIHDQYIESLCERYSDLNGLKKVELGGRIAAKPGYETVDLKDADVICDLNEPWPYADSSVGVIRAFDVFEHLSDPLHTMKEVQRILAPGGWLICQVPSTDGRGAFQDPTHKSYWNENSFFYYTKSFFAKYIDTPVRFQASRLYTTEKNQDQVCWVVAHLVNLKDGFRPAGLVEI
ncbi:MAG TPA: methyltransferase domain-containing protein [Paludibacteraceae bacterium]|nr:methyltransferase domain-containing protein [Paludibacteraceae bacterium]